MADNNVPGAPRGGARLSATPMAQLLLGQRGGGDAPLPPCASGSVPGAPDGAAPPPEPFILDPDFRRLADAMPQMVWTAEPDGTLDHESMAPVVADLFLAGLPAVRTPGKPGHRSAGQKVVTTVNCDA